MSKVGSGCSHDCMACGEAGCSSRKFYDDTASVKAAEKDAVDTEDQKVEEEVNANE